MFNSRCINSSNPQNPFHCTVILNTKESRNTQKRLKVCNQQKTLSLKTKQSLATLAISLLSALTLPLAISSNKALADNEQCTNATLKGSYVFEVNGFFGNQAPFLPAAAVRFVRFDGQGTFSGRGYQVLAGDVGEGNISGTYQVQSNCTVQITFGLFNLDGTQIATNNLFGVVVGEGKKIRTINTSSTAGPATLLESFEKVGD